MDYDSKNRDELIAICKEKGIGGYSGKKKADILKLVRAEDTPHNTVILSVPAPSVPLTIESDKICRLNYIGSKYQLLDWITTNIQEKSGWSSFEGKTIGDLFAGTGIVSYHFRKNGAAVISNDAELYSSLITHAFNRSVYTDKCKETIHRMQNDLDENKHAIFVGFVTTHYSPYLTSERKFFTIENARRIDYLRSQLETLQDDLSDDEYKFILASIILSADAVSNVPAVYGCYLKNFKQKAVKNLRLVPIHTQIDPCVEGSRVLNSDVLNLEFLRSFECDLVYLDPPYNERQYSKNYFPLNIIAKTPTQLLTEEPLKGKTGIPTDCFLSSFCRKGDASAAFETLFRELKTQWIFLSYNSESIVSKDKMLELMQKYGTAYVVERDYKRFKSFEYNNDVEIKEYLFCLKKS